MFLTSDGGGFSYRCDGCIVNLHVSVTISDDPAFAQGRKRAKKQKI